MYHPVTYIIIIFVKDKVCSLTISWEHVGDISDSILYEINYFPYITFAIVYELTAAKPVAPHNK